jgi:hypothetical protein
LGVWNILDIGYIPNYLTEVEAMSLWSKNRKMAHPESEMSFRDARTANLHGLYRADHDPRDLMRINAGTIKNGLFDKAPMRPALGPYADFMCYNWVTDYDINANVWHQGAVGSGTPLAIGDGDRPFATFVTGASDNDFYQYTSKWERVKAKAGKDIWAFGCIKTSEATQIDLWFGLSARINGGTIDASHNIFDNGAGNRYDSIGFRKDSVDVWWDAECFKDGNVSHDTSVLACEANTLQYLGFHVEGVSRVIFYAGSTFNTMACVAELRTNIPDDENLAVIFGARNGDGNARTMTIYPITVLMDKD